jgi:hypothetical protein
MDRLSETADASLKAKQAYQEHLKTDITNLTPRERALHEARSRDLWAEYRELWELSLHLAREELNKAA